MLEPACEWNLAFVHQMFNLKLPDRFNWTHWCVGITPALYTCLPASDDLLLVCNPFPPSSQHDVTVLVSHSIQISLLGMQSPWIMLLLMDPVPVFLAYLECRNSHALSCPRICGLHKAGPSHTRYPFLSEPSAGGLYQYLVFSQYFTCCRPPLRCSRFHVLLTLLYTGEEGLALNASSTVSLALECVSNLSILL